MGERIAVLSKTWGALRGFSFLLGVRVEYEKGSSGGFNLATQTVRIGRNQPLEDRVITLAHEVGHALNHFEAPAGESELRNMAAPGYARTGSCYRREVEAWEHAERLLKDMGSFWRVSGRFVELREASLSEYRKAVNTG